MLVVAGCRAGPAASTCPEPATQADALPYRASELRQTRLTPALEQALAAVRACAPPHPVLGGPARPHFESARQGPDGRALLRFSVEGLADMYLIYVVDPQGRLLKAYVDGP